MSKKLLVVDDSSIIRRVVIRTLRMIMEDIADISEAANGVEALEFLKEQTVDVIFTDINMDDMDGIELINRVKSQEETQHIPIVVISTEGNQNRVEQLMQEGAVGYIKKPFTPEHVRDVLTSLEDTING